MYRIVTFFRNVSSYKNTNILPVLFIAQKLPPPTALILLFACLLRTSLGIWYLRRAVPQQQLASSRHVTEHNQLHYRRSQKCNWSACEVANLGVCKCKPSVCYAMQIDSEHTVVAKYGFACIIALLLQNPSVRLHFLREEKMGCDKWNTTGRSSVVFILIQSPESRHRRCVASDCS
jgi:hypothetical protein